MLDELIDDEPPTPPAKKKDDRDAILVGYLWSKSRKRFVSTRTGKPISDAELRRLFNAHIEDAEGRMGEIATAFHEGRISPAVFVEQMATEQRRHTVQSSALGRGGFDNLDDATLIALTLLLNSTNERIVGTAHDVLEGKVTLPQLLNRVEGYVGEGRRTFFEGLRAGAMATALGGDSVIIARRRLDPNARHCRDCPGYASLGWQLLANTIMPGEQCQCGGHCRCSLVQQVVNRGEVDSWIGTMR